ncbi:MAG: DUF362 domain-containing protein [archaeon]
MAKGVSIQFKSYGETVPKLLNFIKLGEELKQHDKIVLKPFMQNSFSKSTPGGFVEAVLKFCIANKRPEAKIIIAEGANGEETMDLFEESGFKKLAERYNVSIMDLNTSETEEMRNPEFTKFDSIMYPSILNNSFVISLPILTEDPELQVVTSMSNMIGAFPSKHYKGFFTQKKKKLESWPTKFSIHDINLCKMPNLAVIDASEKGVILAGKPLDTDKQAVKLLGHDWTNVEFIRMLDERLAVMPSLSESVERIVQQTE